MSKIPEVQEAVRRLKGVSSASVRWPDPLGPATLRVEFAAGADEGEVTRAVLDALRDIGGADPESLEVQLPEAAETQAHVEHSVARAVFTGLVVERGDLDARVEVQLRHEGRTLSGTAEGMATRQAIVRTAAAATLDALRQLLPLRVRLHVDWLEVIDPAAPGRPQMVQAAVTSLTPGGEELHVGSAFVRGDLREAVVRATLDAVNRRLERLGRRTPATQALKQRSASAQAAQR